MNLPFDRAMREATELTRAHKLSDAVRLIQAALAPADPTSPMPVPQVEGMVDVDGRHERGPMGRPLKRPLGEVVDSIRLAKFHGLAPTTLRGLKPRPTVTVPEGAQFLTRSFTAAAGSVTYKLYVPHSRPASGLPLIVMLHGCRQDPEDFAIGTGMNALAEEFGFLVAYPAQPASANPSSCWNWFTPKHQRRGAGEPSLIAGLTNHIVGEFGLDPKRVFIAGLSAGGAMAAVLGAAYPDVYAAIGVHSGLAYESATDVVSAFAAMRGEVLDRPLRTGVQEENRIRVIVFHGEADRTVHPANAMEIVTAHQNPKGLSTEAEAGICGGRRYTRRTIRNEDGSTQMEYWLIADAGHAWSGGSPDGSFTDVAGPSASREMVRFFLGK